MSAEETPRSRSTSKEESPQNLQTVINNADLPPSSSTFEIPLLRLKTHFTAPTPSGKLFNSATVPPPTLGPSSQIANNGKSSPPPVVEEDNHDDDDDDFLDEKMKTVKHLEKHAFLKDKQSLPTSNPERAENLRQENSRLMYIAKRRLQRMKSETDLKTSTPTITSSKRDSMLSMMGGSSSQQLSSRLLPGFSAPGKQRQALCRLVKVMQLGDGSLWDAIIGKKPLHPLGRFRRIWDQFLFLAVLYTLIAVPFEVAFFSFDDSNLGLVIMGCILDVIFILDLYLSFRTSYRRLDDEYVTDFRKIEKHYLKTWFFLDFLAAIPINIIQVAMLNMGEGNQYMAFVKLLKFIRIVRLRHLFQMLAGLRTSAAIYLFLLILFFLTVAHWAACIFWLIAVEEGIEYSWASLQQSIPDLINEPLNVQYMCALYFSASTISTLGYGDIHPRTYNEQVFCIIFIILGMVLYAGVIGLVSFIIRKIMDSELKKEFFFAEVKSFGRQHKLIPRLQRRIQAYYEFLWERTKGLGGGGQILIDDLPLELRGEFAEAMHRKLFHMNPLIRQCQTMGFQMILAARLNPTTVRSPQDVLYFADDEIQEIFFIKKGLVELIFNMDEGEKEIIVGRLSDGQHCGEMGLFSSEVKKTHVVSALVGVFSDFNSIGVEDFQQLLLLFPRERKLFEAVAKERQAKVMGLIQLRDIAKEELNNPPSSPEAPFGFKKQRSRRQSIFTPKANSAGMSSSTRGSAFGSLPSRRSMPSMTEDPLPPTAQEVFKRQLDIQTKPDFDIQLVHHICQDVLGSVAAKKQMTGHRTRSESVEYAPPGNALAGKKTGSTLLFSPKRSNHKLPLPSQFSENDSDRPGSDSFADKTSFSQRRLSSTEHFLNRSAVSLDTSLGQFPPPQGSSVPSPSSLHHPMLGRRKRASSAAAQLMDVAFSSPRRPSVSEVDMFNNRGQVESAATVDGQNAKLLEMKLVALLEKLKSLNDAQHKVE